MSTILSSGRFDRPHPGHIITIQRLMRRYDHVIIVILDYPQQRFPIAQRLETLVNALSGSKGNLEIIINYIHFGKITREQLRELPEFDVYGSGNEEVLKHMSNLLGENKTIYIPRYPGYSASKEE